MSMAEERIQMLSEEDSIKVGDGLDVYEAMARLKIFRVLLHRPKTAKAIAELLLSLMLNSEISHRRRELIIMRIGWVTGSEYLWTQHWLLAQERFECSAEELLAVREWTRANCFDDTDRAILAATDELLETGDLSDSTWQTCLNALGRDAAIDMVASIGAWDLISKVTRGLRIPIEDGIEQWAPDGLIPPAARRD